MLTKGTVGRGRGAKTSARLAGSANRAGFGCRCVEADRGEEEVADRQMTISPDHQIARLEYVVREQMAEIDQLRAEIDRLLGWINGDVDALTTLAYQSGSD
jgi:hypothetical protein